jgi:hypothetical protein
MKKYLITPLLLLMAVLPVGLKAQALQSALIVAGQIYNSPVASEAPYWINNTGRTIDIFKVFIAMSPGTGTQRLGMVVRTDSTGYLMATGYWPSNGIPVEPGVWVTSEDTFSPYYFELPPGGMLSIYAYSIGGNSTGSAEIWYALAP